MYDFIMIRIVIRNNDSQYKHIFVCSHDGMLMHFSSSAAVGDFQLYFNAK